MSKREAFAGDKKVGQSFLSRPETAFKLWAVPRLPRWIETYHLTALTIPWAFGVIVFAIWARKNPLWLHGVSAMVIIQYVTDLFDGELGRQRNTGLIKWGFLMDHFLDYVFNSCMMVCYAIVAPPGLNGWFMALIVIAGGFMVHSYLKFSVTNNFEIYVGGFGPTEFRVLLCIFNTIIVYAGTGFFHAFIPGACIVGGVALSVVLYMTHREIWAVDMEIKAATEESSK